MKMSLKYLLLAALLSSACQNQPNPGTNVNDDGGGTGGAMAAAR